MNTDKRIKNLKYENIIWGIYIVIIALNFISNGYEKEYYLTKDIRYRKIYKNINIFAIGITILIYAYTEINSYLNYMNKSNNKEKDKFKENSLIASTLILLGGLILLYNAVFDDTIEDEIALE